MRIYYDLMRSNIVVWRDQIDSDTESFNIEDKVYQIIESSEYFLLIDSINSRRSGWVKKEIEYFISNRIDWDKYLVICIVDQHEKVHLHRELFSRQNLWKSFDFYSPGLYDDENKYRLSIEKLCRSLGAKFSPWTDLPELQDFEDEISISDISDENRRSLIRDFENIRLRHLQRSSSVETRLNLLIADCKELGVKSITPYLSLGVFCIETGLENSDIEYIRKSANALEMSLHLGKIDPRPWRAIGISYYYLSRYNESIEAFDRAIRLTLNHSNKRHQDFLEQIISNKIKALLASNKLLEAKRLSHIQLGRMIENGTVTPKQFIDLSHCLSELNDLECLSVLEKGLNFFPGDASIYSQMGKYFFENGEYTSAIECCESAFRYNNKCIQYIAELVVLHFFSDNVDKVRYYSSLCYSIYPQNPLEFYLKGRIYYLNGDEENALKCFNKSKGLIGKYYSK